VFPELLFLYGIPLAGVLPGWFVLERYLRQETRGPAGRFTRRALVGPLSACAFGALILSVEGEGIFAACALAPVLPTTLVILLVALGRPHPAALAASAVLPLATLWAPGWFAQGPDESLQSVISAKTDRWLPVEFGFRRGSQNFLILSTRDLPLSELLVVAEAANALACSALGLDDPDRDRPLPVFLCETNAEVFALEDSVIGHARDPRRESWRYAGGYYDAVPMIAVAVPEDWIKETIPHEVVHSVVARLTPSCPDIIDEGLAGYLTELLLERDGRYAAFLRMRRTRRADVLSAALLRDGIPRLADLFALPYYEFRNQDGLKLNYSLAWCLAKVLLEDTDPQIFNGVPELLRGFDGTADPWEVCCRLYPPRKLESRWTKEILEAAGRSD
jgi:hypothetical protein